MSYSLKRSPLTPDAAERLARACRTLREKRVVWTLLDAGVLVSELVGLTRERIALESHCLYAGACEQAGGKGGIRAIPMTPRIAPLLGSWFGKHVSFGLSARSVQRIVRDVAARAGIERQVCAESLRHTFALAAAGEGTSPLELQRLLGHKSVASTEIYFHLARGGGPDSDGSSGLTVRGSQGPALTVAAPKATLRDPGAGVCGLVALSQKVRHKDTVLSVMLLTPDLFRHIIPIVSQVS